MQEKRAGAAAGCGQAWSGAESAKRASAAERREARVGRGAVAGGWPSLSPPPGRGGAGWWRQLRGVHMSEPPSEMHVSPPAWKESPSMKS